MDLAFLALRRIGVVEWFSQFVQPTETEILVKRVKLADAARPYLLREGKLKNALVDTSSIRQICQQQCAMEQ